MILPLLPEEKIYLARLDPNTKSALKKLFINVAFERPADYSEGFLAAQRIAINMIYDIFRDLDHIQPDISRDEAGQNVV